MRKIELQLTATNCEALLVTGSGRVLERASIRLAGPTEWMTLFSAVADQLRLHVHAVPGLITEGDLVSGSELPPLPFAPVHFETLTVHGYGWGFWLNETETCCGFRDRASTFRAASWVEEHQRQICDLPNATFEVFAMAYEPDAPTSWAFLDLHGQAHATFPTAKEAMGAAAKLENEQMSKA